MHIPRGHEGTGAESVVFGLHTAADGRARRACSDGKEFPSYRSEYPAGASARQWRGGLVGAGAEKPEAGSRKPVVFELRAR
jgi:hypothetical protein